MLNAQAQCDESSAVCAKSDNITTSLDDTRGKKVFTALSIMQREIRSDEPTLRPTGK